MKLSVKILLGIFFPSIISIIIISSIFINRYFNSSLELETKRAYQQFENLNVIIKNSTGSINNNDDIIESVFSNYEEDNIYFASFNDDKITRTNFNKDIDYSDLLELTYEKYKTKVKKINNNNYLFIALKTNDTTDLVYISNINYIYNETNKLITISIITIVFLSTIIIFLAYIISKTLTRPLNKMKKEMDKLSIGNYDINLKESNNEIGSLAKKFNQMAKEIENRNNELLEMIESKQNFIDNLAHEMNTPLTSIYGYTEILQRVELDEEKKYKSLEYIKRETKRITEMYKKLLILSYKENTKLELNQIELNNLYKELDEELQNKIIEKNIKISYEKKIEYIKGDEELIFLAISNLIRNAINNSNENSNIIVSTYEENKYTYISVKDNGIGISEENIKKIIEPFYRVDKARDRKNGGAGLGLSIVMKIMKLHNGELIINSKLGEGSTFILKIPS